VLVKQGARGLISGNFFKWKMRRSAKESALKGNICAAAAGRDSLFAGPANAVFRSAINVWRKICGD
jgi:hypothetical protein